MFIGHWELFQLLIGKYLFFNVQMISVISYQIFSQGGSKMETCRVSVVE